MPNRKVQEQPFEQRAVITDASDDYGGDVRIRQRVLHGVGEILEHDDRPSAAIGELMLELARRVLRIDVHDHHPGPQDAEHEHRRLQQIRQHHGDAIAARKLGCALQVRRKRARQRIDLRRR